MVLLPSPSPCPLPPQGRGRASGNHQTNHPNEKQHSYENKDIDTVHPAGGEVQVWLTDAYGNILRREPGNNGQCTLDLQGLTPGHYYVHLIANGIRMDTRVLIIN